LDEVLEREEAMVVVEEVGRQRRGIDRPDLG
jgi:hypothetical protein